MLGVLGASVAIHRCAGRSAGNHKTRWETRQGGGREAAPRGVRASRRGDRRCQLGPPPSAQGDCAFCERGGANVWQRLDAPIVMRTSTTCGLHALSASLALGFGLCAAARKTQKVIRGACGFVATLCEVCPCMYYLPEPCEHVTAHRGRFGSPGDPAPARGRASRDHDARGKNRARQREHARCAAIRDSARDTWWRCARERERVAHAPGERDRMRGYNSMVAESSWAKHGARGRGAR